MMNLQTQTRQRQILVALYMCLYIYICCIVSTQTFSIQSSIHQSIQKTKKQKAKEQATLFNNSYVIAKNSLASRETVLQEQIQKLLNTITNKTIAILTNPTSTDANMQPIFTRLLSKASEYNFTVKCFFAPQHGLRGDKQAGAGDQDYIDKQINLWVYTLYGKRKAPQKAHLIGVDMVLYDIQDVGCRFYTYIWTLTYTIEALAEYGVQTVIFDRPNPLGRKVEGCPLNTQAGMIGRLLPGQIFTIPQRYGLTIGELMMYLKQYLAGGRWKLTVITMPQWYEIGEDQWAMPSPNMPTLQTALVYPGQGIFQSTTISQGRGTTKPFQLTGFPGIQPSDLLDYFEKINATGYGDVFNLRKTFIIPMFSKNQGQVCGGVQIHIKEGKQSQYNSVQTSLNLLKAYLAASNNNSTKDSGEEKMLLQKKKIVSQFSLGSSSIFSVSSQSSSSLYPSQPITPASQINITTGIDKLFGRLGTRQVVLNQKYSAKDILKQCSWDLEAYQKYYKHYWLYDENYISVSASVSTDNRQSAVVII